MIPPLIGFFGKQSVLLAAIGNGYYFMAILAIIVSVISASYYFKIIKELQTENLNKNTILEKENIDMDNNFINHLAPKMLDIPINTTSPIKKTKNILENSTIRKGEYSYIKLSNIHSFIISSLTLILLFFVLKPSILLNSAMLCTLNYFYL